MAVDEEAKATRAIAETGGKAIDAAREFGAFIAEYTKGSLEQGIGIFEDKLKYMRWERQVRLMKRARDYLEEVGVDQPRDRIPMKIAIPLLQAASLEDDNELQDRWARLLVNAAVFQKQKPIRRIYITTLEQLSPLDALILERIYSFDRKTVDFHIWTGTINNGQWQRSPALIDGIPESQEEVVLSLNTLRQLGLVGGYVPNHMGATSEDEILRGIRFLHTELGEGFVAACTLAPVE